MRRLSTLLLFLLFIVLSLPFSMAQDAEITDHSSSVQDLDADGDYVMGRGVQTTFDYTVEDPYQPIDTVLVLDDSGSMSPDYDGPTRDAAKDYVDATNTADGDKNAVVFFESSATTEQSLTSSKSDAKDAIDGLTGNGGTDLPAGVREGDSALDGNNPIEVMIVLGDGDGGDPKDDADDARDRGVDVHGIMMGTGADSGEFESLTDSTCDTDNPDNEDPHPENADGDNCWYAEEDTVESVYESIQEEVQAQSSANLSMVMPDHVYTEDSYDRVENHPDGQRFVREDIDVTEGGHTESFTWYPDDHGNDMVIKTGESYIDFESNGDTTRYDFTSDLTDRIYYVDLNISGHSLKREDGMIDISLDLENQGNIESKDRKLHLTDEDNNILERDIDPISADSSYEESFEVAENNITFEDAQRITAHFDPDANLFWDNAPIGEGNALEPDESDNEDMIGYPPLLLSTSPDEVKWNETFSFSMNFDHYFPDAVSGNYTAVENGSILHDSRTFNKPAEGTAQADMIDNNDSRIFYNFSGRLVGPEGAVSVYDGFDFYIANPLPEIYGAEPRNMEQVPEEVQLRAYVRDDNSVENPDDLSVQIYNEETGAEMYSEDSLSEGDPIIYDWTTADEEGKIYRWNLTVSDQWDTISQVFRFQKTSRQSYRTETESEYEYSSVVTSAGSPGDFQYTTRNPLDFDKDDMETSLSGVNASFRDGSKTKSYSLPNGTSKTFDIIVKPDQDTEGQQELIVQTVNNELNTTNTERIPVYVRKDSKRTYEAPGIAIYQLVFIYLIALFYTRRFNLE